MSASRSNLHTFGDGRPAVRVVPWGRIPLGSIVIDWPLINGHPIPELMDYPVMTEALRERLTRGYRFLRSRSVTIVDPSLELDTPRVRQIASDATRLLSGISRTTTLKREALDLWRSHPEARIRIGEAAHGGQLVLNWLPLFGYVTVDVYERWLGKVIAGR